MANVFDLSKPGVAVMRSGFGGGWAWPLDAAGTQALREFFDEEPAPLASLDDQEGYIVEPWQTVDLAEHLRSCNVAWKVEP